MAEEKSAPKKEKPAKAAPVAVEGAAPAAAPADRPEKKAKTPKVGPDGAPIAPAAPEKPSTNGQKFSKNELAKLKSRCEFLEQEIQRRIVVQ